MNNKNADIQNVPCRVDTRRLSLVQSGDLAAFVETNNHCRDTEGADTTGLCVALLDTSDVFRNIFNRDGVFDGESVRLGFQAGLVDKDSGISVQSSEGQRNVVIEHLDLRRSDSCVLELHSGALLASQYHKILALDADSASTCLSG